MVSEIFKPELMPSSLSSLPKPHKVVSSITKDGFSGNTKDQVKSLELKKALLSLGFHF